MARIINFGELFFERPQCLTHFSAQIDQRILRSSQLPWRAQLPFTLFCLLARTNDPTNQKIAAPAVIKAKAGIVNDKRRRQSDSLKWGSHLTTFSKN
jgi:hypothetical protein